MNDLVTIEHRQVGHERSLAGDLPRLLVGSAVDGPTDLAEHLLRHGPAPFCGRDRLRRDALIDLVSRAGLTGRGGAGFPTARKLAAVASGRRAAVVIANGTEGEPASAKDKVLLSREPHLVIDGAVLAAEMVGAGRAVLVVHRAVRAIVDSAVAERRKRAIDSVPVEVVTAEDSFVAGEASAVVHWVGRGVATPTRTPPRVSDSGLDGRPTLVQNVETLAHVALIARHGSSWFRSVGTAAEPGSMLVTLIGAVRRPGVYEVGIGTRVSDLVALAGGAVSAPSAALVGGYFGTWVSWGEVESLPFSSAGLGQVGAGPGAGLIAVLPADRCGLVETARVTRYLAGESAGQCGPCVFGLASVANGLEALAAGRTSDIGRLRRWFGQIDGRGGCRHPDGVVRMVRSAFETFSSEIEQHALGWCCGTAATPVLPVPEQVRR